MASLDKLAPSRGARRRSKRLGIGEGSGLGKTCGRGTKGYHSRTGSRKRPGFEGGQNPMMRRLPKKGFSNRMFKTRFDLVALGALEKAFGGSSEPVTLEALKKKGLVSGKLRVKVLSDGELKSKLQVQAHAFSKPAKAALEKAGGKAEVVEFK